MNKYVENKLRYLKIRDEKIFNELIESVEMKKIDGVWCIDNGHKNQINFQPLTNEDAEEFEKEFNYDFDKKLKKENEKKQTKIFVDKDVSLSESGLSFLNNTNSVTFF